MVVVRYLVRWDVGKLLTGEIDYSFVLIIVITLKTNVLFCGIGAVVKLVRNVPVLR
jgi:hypothetical protein